METMFFVSWYIHNKNENAWNAVIVDQYSDISSAKKAYHEQLSMYINDPNFDSVAVLLTNSMGGTELSEHWMPNVAPKPVD